MKIMKGTFLKEYQDELIGYFPRIVFDADASSGSGEFSVINRVSVEKYIYVANPAFDTGLPHGSTNHRYLKENLVDTTDDENEAAVESTYFEDEFYKYILTIASKSKL